MSRRPPTVADTRGVTTDLRSAPRDQAEQQPRAGALPSSLTTALSLGALLVVMARLTVRAAQPLDNADTWFHLRVGHELWGPWSLQHPGRLSSFATSPWLPTQWSTEMLAARVEDWWGLPGVAWLFGALCIGFVAAVYLLCRGQGGPLPAVIAASLAMIGAVPALSARPQVVSLLLVAVVVGSWLRTSRTMRVPWHLVPLTWVWATAHGLWSAGVVIGLVCWLGVVLDRRPGRRTALRLLAVPVLSVVAACLTPLGPALLTSQLAVGQRTGLIAEWGATSFRTGPAFVVALMIGVVVLLWARGRQVAWLPLLLLLLGCAWTVLVTRMVSVGAVLVAPVLAGALQDLLGPRVPWARVRRRELAVVAAGLVACLAALAVAVPRTADRPADVPDGFSSRLAALPAGSAVAVEDLTGSWLEWRFPELDPVIDGMLDAYPVDRIQAFVDWTEVTPGWQQYLRRSGARVAVLVDGSSLTAALQDQLGWRVVDRDGRWVYLVAPGPHR